MHLLFYGWVKFFALKGTDRDSCGGVPFALNLLISIDHRYLDVNLIFIITPTG